MELEEGCKKIMSECIESLEKTLNEMMATAPPLSKQKGKLNNITIYDEATALIRDVKEAAFGETIQLDRLMQLADMVNQLAAAVKADNESW